MTIAGEKERNNGIKFCIIIIIIIIIAIIIINLFLVDKNAKKFTKIVTEL